MQQLILDLFDKGMIKFGEFQLKSGKSSYVYADIRTAISYPHIFKQICDHFYNLIKPLKYDVICGVPYSALTFASGIAYAHSIPMLLKRKEIKDYGTKKMLEGHYTLGDSCLIIEDVITTGISVVEVIKTVEEQGLKVIDVCTLIDRNQGGAITLKQQGYQVHHIMDIYQILDILQINDKITQDDKERALSFI